MDSINDQQPESNNKENQDEQIPPGVTGQQPYSFQWPFPYYPYPPQQQPIIPPVQPQPYRHKRKSRRHRRSEGDKEPSTPQRPLESEHQSASVTLSAQPQQAAIPLNQQQTQEYTAFLQRQFYQDPSQFYNDQMLRNHMYTPTQEVVSQNEDKLREFKRIRKKNKKREKKHRAWEAQQQMFQQQLPFPGAPAYIAPPHNVNLTIPPGGMPANVPMMGHFPGILQPRNSGSHKKRIKAERTATSLYRGVSWDKRDRAYVSRIWVRGQSETVGVFNEELRAAVAVDERLLHLGVSDSHMLNFRTQLERDIALIILLNNHRNSQMLNPAQHKSVAHTLAAIGHTMAPLGVTTWPTENQVPKLSRKFLSKGVSRDNNGNPNSIRSVLKNILKRSSDSKNHKSRSNHDQEKGTKLRLGQKKMTRGKKDELTASSRRRKSKRYKMQETGNGMLGNTLTIHTEERVAGEQSSDGYVGDGEDLVGRTKKKAKFSKGNSVTIEKEEPLKEKTVVTESVEKQAETSVTKKVVKPFDLAETRAFEENEENKQEENSAE